MNTFENWIADYLRAHDIDEHSVATGADGISFESQDGSAFIIQQGSKADQAIVMIPIDDLTPAAVGYGESLLELHRFNEESRWNNDWFVTMATNDVLVLSSVRSLGELRAQTIDAWIDEGLLRRNEVIKLLRETTETVSKNSRVSLVEEDV